MLHIRHIGAQGVRVSAINHATDNAIADLTVHKPRNTRKAVK
jgi:hypothetical protein